MYFYYILRGRDIPAFVFSFNSSIMKFKIITENSFLPPGNDYIMELEGIRKVMMPHPSGGHIVNIHPFTNWGVYGGVCMQMFESEMGNPCSDGTTPKPIFDFDVVLVDDVFVTKYSSMANAESEEEEEPA